VSDPMGAIGLVISTLALAATAILSYRKLSELVRQSLLTHHLKKREVALSFSLTKNERLSQTRKVLDRAFNETLLSRTVPLSTQDFIAAQKRATDAVLGIDVEHEVLNLLAHWENMALAIRYDLADEQAAYEMCGGMVVDYFNDVFATFVADRRREEGRPKLFRELESLIQSWEQRTKADKALPPNHMPGTHPTRGAR